MCQCEVSFQVGSIVATQAVHEVTENNEQFKAFVLSSLQRHLRGDWGDLCDADKELNNHSLTSEAVGRLFSMYECSFDAALKIYIITEWTRECTTILFPSDY